MEAWEYCEAEIHVEGRLMGPKKWLAQVVYYAPSGAFRFEKLATDFNYDPDRPRSAHDAMGQVLATLGQQGWEIVRFQRALDAQAAEARLRRRTGSVPPEFLERSPLCVSNPVQG